MKKTVLEGHIVVAQDDLESVLAQLPTHIVLTRAEVGCIVFSVNQRANDPHVFDVYEEFDSGEAFERHQLRVMTSAWGRATVNVERHYVAREVDM